MGKHRTHLMNGSGEDSDDDSDKGMVYADEAQYTISFFAAINRNSFVTFCTLLDKLDHAASRTQRITVRLTSGGGDAFIGLAMHDAIKRCAHPVDTEACGLVASAAVMPFIAGQVRTIAPYAFLLIHQVRASIYQEICSLDLSVEAANTAILQATYARILGSVGVPSETSVQLLSKESLVDAQLAVSLGIATRLTQSPRRTVAPLP